MQTEKNMAGPYEIIVLDLDGTLTNRDKVVTPRTKAALMKAQERGKKVVLASGRPTQGVMPLAKELRLDEYSGYILSFNGGRIINCKTGETVFARSLPVSANKKIIGLAEENQVDIVTYEGSRIIASNPESPYTKLESRINGMEIWKPENMADGIAVEVVKCGHPDGLTDTEACAYCGLTCNHPGIDSTTGNCTVCGLFQATASVAAGGTTTYFANFSVALEAAKAASGSTLTLFQDVALTGESNLYIDSGTFTIDWNGHTLSGETSNALLCITDAAKVTLTDSVGTGGLRNTDGAAIGVYVRSQGSLTIQGGVYSPQLWKDRTAYGPIQISGGRFENPEDSGRNGALYCYSGVLAELLAPGYTFAYEDDELFDVYSQRKPYAYRTVYVVAHTHENWTDGVCDCGYTCPHEHWTDGMCDLCGKICPHDHYENGKCTVCGYPCPHKDVTENGGVYTCDICGLTMTVMVETADGISYTTDLAAALNNAEDGTTVEFAAKNDRGYDWWTTTGKLVLEDPEYCADVAFTVGSWIEMLTKYSAG